MEANILKVNQALHEIGEKNKKIYYQFYKLSD